MEVRDPSEAAGDSSTLLDLSRLVLPPGVPNTTQARLGLVLRELTRGMTTVKLPGMPFALPLQPILTPFIKSLVSRSQGDIRRLTSHVRSICDFIDGQ